MEKRENAEDLISKREVLETFGISYGALYRWKRMGLIPENWFIRKATATGQETFFDRVQITERIESILQMKDDVSLEEIARRFARGNPADGRALRVCWKYGEKTVPLAELLSLTLVEEDGAETDLKSLLYTAAEEKGEEKHE